MTGRVETADGKVYELPALLEWNVKPTGSVPCDSFTLRCAPRRLPTDTPMSMNWAASCATDYKQ